MAKEKRIIIKEETEVIFKNYEQLSYRDFGSEEVELYVDNVFVGEIEVYTDRENENREYICVNYEVVYLDTIKGENY